MNKSKMIILALGAVLALAGCSGQAEQKPEASTNTNATNPEAKKEEPQKEEAKKEDAKKETSPQAEKKPDQQADKQPAVDLEFVKKNLKDPLTQDQVKKLLGGKYSQVVNAMEDTPVWRYDISPQNGYQFEAKDDSVDIEGIKKQDVKAQLFVMWDEGAKKTVSATYVYLDEKKNTIYSHYIGGELDGKVDEIK